MDKLTISKKEENDNYNLIIENINKLVDMCGSTKEAVELRDSLFNLFTTKYSEPLYDVLGLQEQLGCPLDVFVKATTEGIKVDGSTYKVKVRKDKNGYYFALSNGSCFPFYLSSYKKTWRLEEDRSE